MPLSHVCINVADINQARDFYLAALKPLGYRVIMNFGDKLLGLGGGMCGPDFWLAALDAPSADGSNSRHKNLDMKPGDRIATGRMHVAFGASNRKKVREFYEAAIAAGGKCNGPPGVREEYFSTYYGAFVLEPEGRNIEAVCMKPAFLAEPLGYIGWGTVGIAVGGAAGCFGRYMGWI